MKLIIAQKSSHGKDIAKAIGAKMTGKGYAEGNGFLVSWCDNNLVHLAAPEHYDPKLAEWRLDTLPILPDPMQYVGNPKKERRLQILCSLMERPDVDSLICATDASHEGELLFRALYQVSGCSKPWQRLWITALTKEAILDGMANLLDSQIFDNMATAAMCREQADWMVGMNFSRFYSKTTNRRLPVGRVQTHALHLLVEQEERFVNFRTEPYYEISFQTQEGITFSKRFAKENQKDYEACLNEGAGLAVIQSIRRSQRTEEPPKLFTLTTLQQEASRLFQHTAAETLAALMVLYDGHLCTNPQTDYQYAPVDLTPVLRELYDHMTTEGILPDGEVSFEGKSLVDDTAISLLPTLELTADRFRTMDTISKHLLLLMIYRIAECGSAAYRCEEITVDAAINERLFCAKLENEQEEGWKQWDRHMKEQLELAPEAPKQASIPFSEGEKILIGKRKQEERTTKRPPHCTESALLGMMVGTPAARGAVIEKMIHSGYVFRDQHHNLMPTVRGGTLDYTAHPLFYKSYCIDKLEQDLREIEAGTLSAESFLSSMRTYVEMGIRFLLADNLDMSVMFYRFQDNNLLKCPRCQSNVHETDKGFLCMNSHCGFAIWKNDPWFLRKKKEVTAKLVEDLLKYGRTNLTDCYSQNTHRRYDAVCVLHDDGNRVSFSLEFS